MHKDIFSALNHIIEAIEIKFLVELFLDFVYKNQIF